VFRFFANFAPALSENSERLNHDCSNQKNYSASRPDQHRLALPDGMLAAGSVAPLAAAALVGAAGAKMEFYA
jgi:hypothetical protein